MYICNICQFHAYLSMLAWDGLTLYSFCTITHYRWNVIQLQITCDNSAITNYKSHPCAGGPWPPQSCCCGVIFDALCAFHGDPTSLPSTVGSSCSCQQSLNNLPRHMHFQHEVCWWHTWCTEIKSSALYSPVCRPQHCRLPRHLELKSATLAVDCRMEILCTSKSYRWISWPSRNRACGSWSFLSAEPQYSHSAT